MGDFGVIQVVSWQECCLGVGLVDQCFWTDLVAKSSVISIKVIWTVLHIKS
jgi:hypothetical protein